MNYILSIDLGTTGVQASLFRLPDFTMLGNNKVPLKIVYPNPGWVEQSPQDIWKATQEAIKNCIATVALKNVEFKANEIITIGISNQRETCVAWHKNTGETHTPAIVWQDRRTAEFCEALAEKKFIHKKTGLLCDPYFSASKMNWILKNSPQCKAWEKQNKLCLGTIDSFVLWNLTAGKSFVTDHTNASRTLLYNIHSGIFDSELCELFQLEESCLPTIIPSSSLIGYTSKVPELPDGIPITGVLGDQQAALFGQQCFYAGEGKITFGTGAFLLMNTGPKIILSEKGLLTTVSFSDKDTRTFALEGSAFIAGSAIQFLRDQFGWIQSSGQVEQVALSEPRDPNVLFVPALSGLGTPYWNPLAKGVLFGLTRGTKKEQIIRAVLESIALQNVELLSIMSDESKHPLTKIGVDGGASKNNYLMQFQTDLSRVELIRPQNIESTSLGAAFCAWMGISGCRLDNLPKIPLEKKFLPIMPENKAKEILNHWLRATQCVNEFYTS